MVKEENETKKRIDYIDMVKGFSIMMIVLGHIISPSSYIFIWMYSFHVPIFFILVGWLAYKKEYKNISMKELIKKEIKSLLYPYFMFSMIFVIYDIGEFFLSKEQTSINFIIKDILMTISLHGNKTLWFLTCLFFAKIIYSYQKHRFSDKAIWISNMIILIMICFISHFILEKMPTDTGINFYLRKIIYTISRPMVAVLFIHIGECLHTHMQKKTYSWILIISCMTLNVFLAFGNGRVDLYSMKLNSIFLYFLESTIGSLGIILFFQKVKPNRFIRYVGKNSLIIMITHQKFPFIKLGKDVFSLVRLPEVYSNLFTFILVMGIEIVLIYLINHHANFLIKYKTKGNITTT